MNGAESKLDLRVRRTYKFLWDALIGLMSERSFEAITVTDICERAMVHRTTFYKHYEDKYALLYQGIQAQLRVLFEDLNLPVGETAVLDEKTEMLPLLITLFEHVLQHEEFYRLMLCGDGIGKFYPLFSRSLVEHFLERSDAHARRDDRSVVLRSSLRARAHAGVLLSTIAWWLEQGCPYTAAEMGEFVWEDAFA